MARAKQVAAVKPVVVATPAPQAAPSFVEKTAMRSLVSVQTGDCALVRGVIAGLDERVVAHASAARDARVEFLVAQYLAS